MQIKVFSAAFLGKVAAAIFLATCTFLGFGPDKWVAFVITDLPTSITPAIARGTFLGLAVLTAALLLKAWSVDRTAQTTLRLPPGTAPSSARVSLHDLAREAEKRGWRMLDPSSRHSLDFLDGVRQLGIDGNVATYGRIVRLFPELTQHQPLVQIPNEIWRTHHVEVFSFFRFGSNGHQTDYAPHNLNTRVVPLSPTAGATQYADLHLDRQGALAWLASAEAVGYRGRRDALETRRESPRRIRLTEAVLQAYEQTQGSLAAAAAENLASGDVEGWYAAAITKDRDVTVYGCKPPSRVHVEVPQEHLQSFMFAEKANELVDQFDDRKRYVDLEISAADLERKITTIKAWH